MLKEKWIPPLFLMLGFLTEEELRCRNLKNIMWKKHVTSTKKSCHWTKVALEKSCFRFTRFSGFTWQNNVIIKTPQASLERHQMYKDDLFLDFNCLIIPAAPKRLCCIRLISLWQSQCYSTLVWATFSWHSHQASHSLEQNPLKMAKNIFSTKEWLIDIND